MQEFLLIVKGRPQPDLSPAKTQARIEEYRAWARSLGERHIEAERLDREGAYVQDSKTVMTDGPFLEAKEIIAGYIFIRAAHLDEATAIAQTCPLLEHCDLIVHRVISNDEA